MKKKFSLFVLLFALITCLLFSYSEDGNGYPHSYDTGAYGGGNSSSNGSGSGINGSGSSGGSGDDRGNCIEGTTMEWRQIVDIVIIFHPFHFSG